MRSFNPFELEKELKAIDLEIQAIIADFNKGLDNVKFLSSYKLEKHLKKKQTKKELIKESNDRIIEELKFEEIMKS